MDSHDSITPAELAKELGVPPKKIRAWLRGVEMRPEAEKYLRWHLTHEEAEFVRRAFTGHPGGLA